jgi:probable rRNA maturation factor
MKAAGPALELSLQFADGSLREHLPRHRVRRWVRAALQGPGQITVRVVGAEEGRELNRQFRGKDYATNVLTFNYEEAPVVVADLILCAPVLVQEALAQGLAVQAHCAHLLVHGTLHAQGWDHEEDEAARAMEAQESAIVQALGFEDPYAGALRSN